MATERFDKEAATWDSNRFTVNSSKRALGALILEVPDLKKYRDGVLFETPELKAQRLAGNDSGLKVLEIGCGTGLLSLILAPYVAHLTAVDTSAGMIAALQAKLAAQTTTTNVLPVYIELKGSDGLTVESLDTSTFELGPQRYDLVISHLTLHHIPRLDDILTTMYGVLNKGGKIALTDFENTGPEAQLFHPKSKWDTIERHGIGKAEMEKLIEEAGFVDVDVKEGWRMDKDVEGGESAEFPFLICLGRKP